MRFKMTEERIQTINTPEIVQRDMIDNNSGVFERAAFHDFDLTDFILKFMNSEVAEIFDVYLSRYRWEGPQGIYLEFLAECEMYGREIKEYTGDLSRQTLMDIGDWIGYIYRLTHYTTGDSSKEIVRLMPPEYMIRAYWYGHTQDPLGWIQEFLWDNDLKRWCECVDNNPRKAEKRRKLS